MRRIHRLLPFPILLALAACARPAGDPNNTILAEIAPPDGAMKAVIFERAGGPGGATTTQVSVLPLEESLPMGPGNVFISDAKPAGGRGISVKWTGPTGLKIAYPEGIGVYRNQEAHEGVIITYEVLEPPATVTEPADASGDEADPTSEPAPAVGPDAAPVDAPDAGSGDGS